ncbi:MAG TPA: hypothetical protein VHI52_23330, partial [Verrucomicrobiae bacterium]|nr:hypothetical protein [Verrucomicrobiae bacterium]
IPEGRCILAVTEGPPATSRPAMDRSGSHLAIGFADGYCQLFSLETRKLLAAFPAHKSFCYACDFSPKGDLLLTAGFDGLVRLWATQTQRLLREFRSSADAYWSVAFSPDGKRIAAGTGESTIVMWDAINGKEVAWLDLGEPLGPVEGQLRFSPDGSSLVLCGANRWRVWSTR